MSFLGGGAIKAVNDGSQLRINGAQVIVDQFLSAGLSKWGLTTRLTLLLPHGYEGQGPEHSSARPERFLQAAADINLRLVNCTTAAQYFHVLRRQAALLERDPLPLIVLTPKSLLRHPAVASTPQELTEGHFRSVLDDTEASARAKSVRRLVLCSGKVALDLFEAREKAGLDDVSIVRLEQLYPFPGEPLAVRLKRMTDLEEVIWCQEEPRNNGAWFFVASRIETALAEGGHDGMRPQYVGRDRAASPATGLASRHAEQQAGLVAEALGVGSKK